MQNLRARVLKSARAGDGGGPCPPVALVVVAAARGKDGLDVGLEVAPVEDGDFLSRVEPPLGLSRLSRRRRPLLLHVEVIERERGRVLGGGALPLRLLQGKLLL